MRHEDEGCLSEDMSESYCAWVQVQNRLEEVQVELENVGSDMDKMTPLLDEMERLNNKAVDLDMSLLDSQVDKMMPELGFTPEDNDRLVASFRFGSAHPDCRLEHCFPLQQQASCHFGTGQGCVCSKESMAMHL